MTEVVVSDTTPLQYLHQSGTLELLPQLFSAVIVPPAVIAELAKGLELGHDLPRLAGMSWIKIRAPVHVLELPNRFGRGEQEAISLAAELRLSVMMDDYDARMQAISMGLHVLGTFGVLLLAKRKGHLAAVMPILEIITKRGFRISEQMRQHVRGLAGE
jgi:uncharacterized protein